MPPSEGQEPRALIVAVQAIDGRKCAETAKVHPDLRIVFNLAYGVLADEAGRFPVTGNYTTKIQKPILWMGFFVSDPPFLGCEDAEAANTSTVAQQQQPSEP